jgi:Methyltransferase domain
MLDELEDSGDWLRRLYELNGVIAACGERVAGNLFYDHYQSDYLESPPVAFNRAKRDRFRRACAGRARMLEVGVNGGHSAFLALSSNPSLEFHGVDIAEHAYVRPAAAWLEQEFPGRFFFHEGSCLKLLPEIARRGLRFDLFHIDGAKHTYYFDILNCHRMLSSDGALVILDDFNMRSVERVWRRSVSRGLVEPLAEFDPMPESEEHRNAIGALPPVSKSTWLRYSAEASFRSYRRRLRRRLALARRDLWHRQSASAPG